MGLSSFWNTVLEYNGRQKEGSHVKHQITAGLQWAHSPWIIEGGVFKVLNAPYDLSVITSIRFRM